MFRNVMISFAGVVLTYAPMFATEMQKNTENSERVLLAAGGSNCPVYYGCPAPAPAPKGGNAGGGNSGGGKTTDPSQKPA